MVDDNQVKVRIVDKIVVKVGYEAYGSLSCYPSDRIGA